MSEDQISTAARMAAEWWADRLMSGDKEKFFAKLRELVEAELRSHGHCDLECDYDPRGALLEAVKAAGLECRGFFFSCHGILPEKHSLWVTPESMEPKEGYGNWKQAIPVTQQHGTRA